MPADAKSELHLHLQRTGGHLHLQTTGGQSAVREAQAQRRAETVGTKEMLAGLVAVMMVMPGKTEPQRATETMPVKSVMRILAGTVHEMMAMAAGTKAPDSLKETMVAEAVVKLTRGRAVAEKRHPWSPGRGQGAATEAATMLSHSVVQAPAAATEPLQAAIRAIVEPQLLQGVITVTHILVQIMSAAVIMDPPDKTLSPAKTTVVAAPAAIETPSLAGVKKKLLSVARTEPMRPAAVMMAMATATIAGKAVAATVAPTNAAVGATLTGATNKDSSASPLAAAVDRPKPAAEKAIAAESRVMEAEMKVMAAETLAQTGVEIKQRKTKAKRQAKRWRKR